MTSQRVERPMTFDERSKLKVRLHKVAFGTTFLDARADILGALTELDRMAAALNGLIEHAIPSNWDDDEDPDQVAAWLAAFELTGADPIWSGQ